MALPAGQAELTLDGQQLMLAHDGQQLNVYVLAQWLGFEEPGALSLSEAALRLPVIVKGANSASGPIGFAG